MVVANHCFQDCCYTKLDFVKSSKHRTVHFDEPSMFSVFSRRNCASEYHKGIRQSMEE
jgi:hypothetical protein